MAESPPEQPAGQPAGQAAGQSGPAQNRIVYQIEESKAGSSYEAMCPELVITGFGDTPELARDSLRRQVAGYLEDCDEMGILDEALIEAGFYFTGELWMSNEVEPAHEPDIVIL